MLCDQGAINAPAAASMLRMDPMPLATRGFRWWEKVRGGRHFMCHQKPA
jgi:hypothetical protein